MEDQRPPWAGHVLRVFSPSSPPNRRSLWLGGRRSPLGASVVETRLAGGPTFDRKSLNSVDFSLSLPENLSKSVSETIFPSDRTGVTRPLFAFLGKIDIPPSVRSLGVYVLRSPAPRSSQRAPGSRGEAAGLWTERSAPRAAGSGNGDHQTSLWKSKRHAQRCVVSRGVWADVHVGSGQPVCRSRSQRGATRGTDRPLRGRRGTLVPGGAVRGGGRRLWPEEGTPLPPARGQLLWVFGLRGASVGTSSSLEEKTGWGRGGLVHSATVTKRSGGRDSTGFLYWFLEAGRLGRTWFRDASPRCVLACGGSQGDPGAFWKVTHHLPQVPQQLPVRGSVEFQIQQRNLEDTNVQFITDVRFG